MGKTNLAKIENELDHIDLKKIKNKELIHEIHLVTEESEKAAKEAGHNINYLATLIDDLKKFDKDLTNDFGNNAKQHVDRLKKSGHIEERDVRRFHRVFIRLMKPLKHLVDISHDAEKEISKIIHEAHKTQQKYADTMDSLIAKEIKEKKDEAEAVQEQLIQLQIQTKKMISQEYALEERLIAIGANNGELGKEIVDTFKDYKKHVDYKHMQEHVENINTDLKHIYESELGLMSANKKIPAFSRGVKKIVCIAALMVATSPFLHGVDIGALATKTDEVNRITKTELNKYQYMNHILDFGKIYKHAKTFGQYTEEPGIYKFTNGRYVIVTDQRSGSGNYISPDTLNDAKLNIKGILYAQLAEEDIDTVPINVNLGRSGVNAAGVVYFELDGANFAGTTLLNGQ